MDAQFNYFSLFNCIEKVITSIFVNCSRESLKEYSIDSYPIGLEPRKVYCAVRVATELQRGGNSYCSLIDQL